MKEVEEFGKQSEKFDHENRTLDHKVKVLKDPNNIFECMTALYLFSISEEKID